MTTTVIYFVFFLLLVIAQFVQRRVARQLLLLTASYIFYASWGKGFWATLVLSSVFNFICGALLQRKPTLPRLWAGITGNILLLGFFKYAHAAASIVHSDFLNGVAMPVGISFWTFQALSYLFDVYRQEDVDPSLLEFCLYLAFWPTVVLGPICRLPNMLAQFREPESVSPAGFLGGLHRIIVGLFMKLVMAQVLVTGLSPGGGLAAGFDGNAARLGGLDVWFLAIGFGFQLFFDFAGYSHIVIGAAQLFGFRLEENFNSPYLSSTPSEFWTRWHMSLSSWIRDYVFVPIATSRREIWWRYLALLFSMTLFGLWHGAKVTFLLWGVYHGVLLVLHRMVQQLWRNWGAVVSDAWTTAGSWAVTLLTISLGWILFRANDLHQALTMFRAALSPGTYTRELPSSYYVLVLVLIAGYFGFEIFRSSVSPRIRLATAPLWRRCNLPELGMTRGFLSLVALIPMVFILLFGTLLIQSGSDGVSPFVYTLF
jgi:alginate O-acetyltransferase complex protein AlgI